MLVASQNRRPTLQNLISPLFDSSNTRLGPSLLATLLLQSTTLNRIGRDPISVVNSLVSHLIGF